MNPKDAARPALDATDMPPSFAPADRVVARVTVRGRVLAAVLGLGLLLAAGCGTGPAASSPGSPSATAPGGPSPAASSGSLPPPSSPLVAKEVDGMRDLAFMLGRWEGDGTIRMGPGRQIDFHQTERVDLQLSGEVMTVAGNGVVPGNPSAPSFSAFAVTTFDPATGTHRWEAFSQGSRVDTTLTVTANGWTWGFDPRPGISTRYAGTFTGDTWHETGQTSTDRGRTWTPSLDMTLHRTA